MSREKHSMSARCFLLPPLFVLLVGGGSQAKDEAKGLKVVETLGGKVVRDDKVEGNPIIEVDLDETRVTDTELKELIGMKQLRALSLRQTEVTDVGLRELTGLKQIRRLDLGRTIVTDRGLKELAEMTELQTLNPAPRK